MKLVPDRREETILVPGVAQFLDEKIINQPATALHLVTKEVIRCGRMVEVMLAKVNELSEKEETVLLSEIENTGNAVKKLYTSINDYLNAMFAEGVMTEE